jgi:fructokinase
MIQGLEYADIIKVSEEELQFITGIADLQKGTEKLCQAGIKVVFVTLGANGCYYRYKGGYGLVHGYIVAAIDTTGAGDAFLGAALYRILNIGWENIDKLDNKSFEEIVRFANGAGAFVTTKKGAIPAMPKLNDILELCDR